MLELILNFVIRHPQVLIELGVNQTAVELILEVLHLLIGQSVDGPLEVRRGLVYFVH